MNNQQSQSYFDFTADAVAFINEIRTVSPEKARKERFIALKVCILEGENGEHKEYCDLIARGAQALQVLEYLQQEWPQGNDSGPSWIAGLRIGSLYAKAYTSRKGEAKAALGGRLLAIKWLKIGDERIDVPEWRSDATASEQEELQSRNQSSQRQFQNPPQRGYQGGSQDQRPQSRQQYQQQSSARSQNPQRSRYQESSQDWQQARPQRQSQNPQRSCRYQEQQQSEYHQQTA